MNPPQFSITNLEITQATMEIFGGFVCLMIMLIIILNGRRKRSRKCLTGMYFTEALIMFSEACAYIFRGNTDRLSLIMTRLSNFGVFFLNIVLLGLFVEYMYSFFREKGLEPAGIFRRLAAVGIALNLVILVTNFFTRWMYFFDAANCYHRNTGWYVFTFFNVMCILIAIVMVVRYRAVMSRMLLIATVFYLLVPVLSILLNALFYGFSITNLGIFIAMLVTLLAYLKEWRDEEALEEQRHKSFEIILLFAIMTLSMSASLASCILSISRISGKTSETSSILAAEAIYDGIENQFLRPVIVSQTMAQDVHLKEYLRLCGEESPEAAEEAVSALLDSIRSGFGYQTVFAVCDATKTYYTNDGISRTLGFDNSDLDIWYPEFLARDLPYELNVDLDKDNRMALSMFVNHRILDANDDLIGVCGVAVRMEDFQALLRQCEAHYNVRIDLLDANGMILVDSDTDRIERDTLTLPEPDKLQDSAFYYEALSSSSRMTRYMKNLGLYLMIEDCSPNKINVLEITLPSVVIFIVGIAMMGIAFFVIIVREHRASKELVLKNRLSLADDMTGLFNRRAYEEDCRQIEESGTLTQMTMLLMDINDLKTTNDTHGHLAGDELIIGAARCIQSSIGLYGRVYRIGGDEFIALIRCTEDQLRDALSALERMTQRWDGTYVHELSISKGVVLCREHEGLSLTEIKRLADQAMYADKAVYYHQTGRNRRRR